MNIVLWPAFVFLLILGATLMIVSAAGLLSSLGTFYLKAFCPQSSLPEGTKHEDLPSFKICFIIFVVSFALSIVSFWGSVQLWRLN